MRSPRPALLLLLPLTMVLQAERCGPAGGLHAAYLPGTVVADDTLLGTWVTVSAGPSPRKRDAFPPATIKREDTADGPSYLLSIADGDPKSELKDVRFRLFLFDIEGKRYADLIAEDLSKTGRFAKNASFPQHLYFRVMRTPADGVALEFLEAEYVDAEVAKDPKSLPTVELVQRFTKDQDGQPSATKEALLSADALTLQRLLARASENPEAWSLGVELTRKDAPALHFTLTTHRNDATGARDESFHVVGTRLQWSSTPLGKDAPPARTGEELVKNPGEIQALVKAFQKTAPAKARRALKGDARVIKMCLVVMNAKARCVERLEGDTSGADLAALETLRDALRALVSAVR